MTQTPDVDQHRTSPSPEHQGFFRSRRAEISFARIQEGRIPGMCLVCGHRVERLYYSDVEPPTLKWLWFIPVPGPVAMWWHVGRSATRYQDHSMGLPFCEEHREYWSQRAGLIISILIMGLALGIGIWLFAPIPLGDWCQRLFRFWLIGLLPLALFLHFTSMRPVGMKDDRLVLTRVNERFAKAMAKKNSEES